LAVDADLHREALVDAEVDELGAVEVVELVGGEQVEHAPGACRAVGLEVGDTPFAGADRDVEAEPGAVEPGAAGRERVHGAAIEKDRAIHVAAVGEVPEGVVGHAATSAEVPRWRRYMSRTHRYAGCPPSALRYPTRTDGSGSGTRYWSSGGITSGAKSAAAVRSATLNVSPAR